MFRSLFDAFKQLTAVTDILRDFYGLKKLLLFGAV